MDILISTSLLTAFIAGVAALLAPCCITVLLPGYLASIFKQRRTVFLMTFIFFLGVLAVFLPLGLGIAAVGQFLKNYHNQLYIAGGLFLAFLGSSILIGQHFSMPFNTRFRGGRIEGAGSIFLLGIFSGFATLCCAPVLAGVMALSVLPGSIFWGGLYSLVYTMGMVMPLFVIAYFLDKSNFAEKFSVLKKRISYSFFSRQINVTVSEFVAGAMYFLMGVLIIYLDLTNQLAMGGGTYQMSVNIYIARLTKFLQKFLGKLPWLVWVAAVFFAIVLISKVVMNKIKEGEGNKNKPS